MVTSTAPVSFARRPASIPEKILREMRRPFRQLVGGKLPADAAPAPAVNSFHPGQATLSAEEMALLAELVRESRPHGGPIVEIGTLMGITTTTIALFKGPDQRVITVDNYGWNPWGMTPAAHAALAAHMLRYLVETGHVERVTMDKNEFFRTYSGPAPSLAFLDAIHDYEETKKDILWAREAGAAVISGHDYKDEFPGVIEVVHEFGGPRLLAGSVWVL